MRDLRIVVCVKVTPKPEEVGVDLKTNLLDRANARSEINPPDMNTIELALSQKDLHGGVVHILSMGPPFFEPYLRVGLAMGADHVFLLSDPSFGGADTLATTYTLAKGIEKIGDVDLVLCGEESSDGATGQVPPGLAEWLDWSQITLVNQLNVDLDTRRVTGRRELPGGFEILQVPLPAVISVKSASNEPRFMDYRIKEKAFRKDRVTVWSARELDTDEEYIGLRGSPTRVSGLAQAPSRERRREFVTGSPHDISEMVVKLLDELVQR